MVEQAKAWKFLKDCVAKIPDKTLQNVFLAEFRKRAVRDWGYNPDSKYGIAKETVELDDWEQELVNDINDFNQYQVNTRGEKSKATAKEAEARMLDFICRGGCWADIPEDMRTESITKLYTDCLIKHGDYLIEETDRLLGGNK